jgi:hypothetical protein
MASVLESEALFQTRQRGLGVRELQREGGRSEEEREGEGNLKIGFL